MIEIFGETKDERKRVLASLIDQIQPDTEINTVENLMNNINTAIWSAGYTANTVGIVLPIFQAFILGVINNYDRGEETDFLDRAGLLSVIDFSLLPD